MARTVFESSMFDVELFPVTTPAGDAEFVRLRAPNWVNIAPITADGDLVLIRQHRHGINAGTLEVPGGIVDGDEAAGVAAMRELREETGYDGGTVHPLATVHPNPAIQDNVTDLFAVLGVELQGEQDLDPHEEVEVTLVPLRDLDALVRSGAITHALALNTCLLVLLRRDDPDFAPYFARSAAAAG
ncbi:MAG: NUDIX hydrolase [Proteobacteria bacterium]|nr:NUDIX hydrolase [Pseudomonadota bacterium]